MTAASVPEAGSKWRFTTLDPDDSPVFEVVSADRYSVSYRDASEVTAPETERVTAEFLDLFKPA